MSLLAPLYFLGALAVSLPILFHLIRRQPKGQIEFSSLMFLRPSPPRLTRRSRLDNWPLLLIRALALMLLAAAFARPFLRSVALSDAELPGRRLVLVVDTSASMQRAGLWQQALDKATDVLSDLQPADRLAVVSFDTEPTTLLGFEQSSQLTPTQLKTTAENLLREIGPSWRGTDVGRAISYAGDMAVTFEPEDDTQLKRTELGIDDESADAAATSRSGGPAHLVLVTDMQSGSRMENLQVYAWPKELRLDVRKVVPKDRTNASLQILAATADPDEEKDRVRVRVSNSGDATESRFRMRWSSTGSNSLSSGDGAGIAGSADTLNASELPIQVPPGQTRVVRMPAPVPGVTALVLQGDDHTFDNTRYLVSPQPENVSLIHIGNVETDDPRNSLFYYLQRVPFDSPQRTVSLQVVAPDQVGDLPEPKETPLVIVADAVSAEAATKIRSYIEAGGRVLAVLAREEKADQAAFRALGQSVNAIAGDRLTFAEAEVDDYVMFSRIDFRHPLFAPMADPQFNDFTKIRFWSHRSIGDVGDQWTTVTRFDDGEPAIIETKIGDGNLFVMAAGWQPVASQLAMSTKFIPLVFSLFESSSANSGSDSYTVGQPIQFEPSESATITGPAGTAFEFSEAADLEQIDQPGIYRFTDGDTDRTFAVNLDAAESQTEAVDEEELQRFGVILGKNLTTAQAIESQRQLRDQELEGQQKIWQWLLVAVLALLALETILGKIWSRRGSAAEPQVTSV